jgi:hypothetical protein
VAVSPDAIHAVVAEHACEGIYRLESKTLADLILEAARVEGDRISMARETPS